LNDEDDDCVLFTFREFEAVVVEFALWLFRVVLVVVVVVVVVVVFNMVGVDGGMFFNFESNFLCNSFWPNKCKSC
jgi:hypothetical protein